MICSSNNCCRETCRFHDHANDAHHAGTWGATLSASSRGASAPSVLVFGAGIGGLTVAHELAERGFRVTIVEKRAIAGGKARSVGIAGTGQGGRRDLPAEHGFRFFPGSYRHLFDTMERIPVAGRRRGVRDQLVRVPYQQQEYPGCPTLLVPTSKPANREEAVHKKRQFANARTSGFTADEVAFYVERRWQFLTSCDERRDGEYDAVSWWEFMDADGRSAAYQDFIGKAPMNFVAARPTLASMRTLGTMAIQLDRAGAERGNSSAWILNGPTNDVWIDPWLAHLDALGIERRRGALRSLVTSAGRISHAIADTDEGPIEMRADFYVCALPVEAMAGVIDEALLGADEGMRRIVELSQHVGWMSGMQYFLDYVPELPPAHQNYIGSPWAITSIVQSAFWSGAPISAYGDGTIRSVLSVIVSDWDSPGLLLEKPASQCTPEEIRAEVWHQMRHWADGFADQFRVEGIRHFELDAELEGDRVMPRYVNRSPLLINVVGSRRLRPEAATGLGNLFLAADYVRTFTDLATMEGANEAGRRAANGIIAASGLTFAPAGVWRSPEARFVGWWKAYDKRRFDRGLPWDAHAPLWVRWPLVLLRAYVRRCMTRAEALPRAARMPPTGAGVG